MEDYSKIKIAFSLLLNSLKSSSNNKYGNTQLKQFKQLVNQSEGDLKNSLLVILNKLNNGTDLSNSDIIFELQSIYNTFFQKNHIDTKINAVDNKKTTYELHHNISSKENLSDSTVKDSLFQFNIVRPVEISSNSSTLPLQQKSHNDKNLAPSQSISDSTFEFTREDGSILKITPVSSSKNVYFSNLKKYKVVQKFPHIGNFSAINFIYTSINMDLLHTSASYASIIKNSLSAQNIYKAATEHYGFLYSGNPTFNSSAPQLLSVTESECMHDCLDNRPPFSDENGLFKRLLPITIFSTPSGIISQLEYCISGLKAHDSNLKYVFTNIDYNKLCSDDAYRNAVLAQLDKSEDSLHGTSSNSTYFCINYNSLTSKYYTSNDSAQYEMINGYIDYVTHLHPSIHINSSSKYSLTDR